MTTMLDDKGQMRTVEAFLAILLLFSALTVATSITPAANLDNHDTMKSIGMQALASADSDGQLGRLIEERDWTGISNVLNTLLPVSISYNLTIYDENFNPVNNVSISNGMIQDRNVFSVQYPCASPSTQSSYYLLSLQLATAR